MAFNGSEHYKPGTLIEFFQRMGMNFGGDTNASTGFERTLYLLELPDTKAATATSFAAERIAGAVPPAAKASSTVTAAGSTS